MSSFSKYVGNGAQTVFTVNQPMPSYSALEVSLDGLVETTGFTYNRTNATVTFAVAPADGVVVKLSRVTQVEPLHKFATGAAFTARNVDTNFTQESYRVEELQDNVVGVKELEESVLQASEDAEAALAQLLASSTDYIQVGTFAAGYDSLQTVQQTLLHSDGHRYGWTGPFPKTVPAGSTPTPLGSGGWIDRTDAVLRDELASDDGANLVRFKVSSSSLAVNRTVLDRLIERSVSIVDFGADPTGATDSTNAIKQALLFANHSVYAPEGTYNISENIIIPPQTFFFGTSLYWTVFNATADVTLFTLRTLSKIANMRLTRSGTHTRNGIDVGNLTLDAARSAVESVYIQGMGNDGIQVRKGNLGTIRDVVCLSNGRDGINFTNETIDNNAWKLEGFIDVRSNIRDGLHFDGGTSVGDALASRSHSADLVSAQQNGRYGVYCGSRSNRVVAYTELNSSSDFYFDTHGQGNDVVALEGSTLTQITPASNKISWHNRNADYVRCERSMYQFSGRSGMGWQVNADDATAGRAYFQKTATREFTLALAGSVSYGTLHVINAESGQVLYTDFGGPVRPSSDNVYTLGNSSYRWSTVYAGTGTINTSDAREKTTPLAIDDAVLDAWGDVQLITFQWLASVAQKGDSARWHFGVIAQQVRDAFAKRGIDGTKYGLLCYDEWADEYATVYAEEENGERVDTGNRVLTKPAGGRWGIRHDQCLFLEAAYQRRNHHRLLMRIEKLESNR